MIIFNEKRIKILAGIFFCLFVLVLTNCNKANNALQTDNGISDTLIEKNFIQIAFNQKLCYKRMFINIGAMQLLKVPDTLIGYSNFEVIGDTMISNELCYLIDGTDYEVACSTIVTYHKRFALNNSDLGLKVFVLENENSLPTMPFKRRTQIVPDPFQNYYLTDRVSSLKKLLSNVNSDYDFFFPIIFPIHKDSSWFLKIMVDSATQDMRSKTYVGRENYKVFGKTYNCYKFRWKFEQSTLDSVQAFDWYYTNGLVRRVFNYGVSTVLNENGDTLGAMQSIDETIYVGNTFINPDTLVPWGVKK